MPKRNIIILILVMAVIIGVITAGIINAKKKTTVMVECKSHIGECNYLLTDGLGNTLEEKNFNFSDIMQCNIETVYKKDVLERDVAFAFDFYLHFNNDEKVINFKHKDGKKLSGICSNILEKKPFSYKFKVK